MLINHLRCLIVVGAPSIKLLYRKVDRDPDELGNAPVICERCWPRTRHKHIRGFYQVGTECPDIDVRREAKETQISARPQVR